MAFFIKIDDGQVITLPTDIGVDERIKLCEEVIESYPQYFEQSLPINQGNSNACAKVMSRLDIMATYILNAIPRDKDCTHPTITDYKQERNKRTEVSFTDIEKHSEY